MQCSRLKRSTYWLQLMRFSQSATLSSSQCLRMLATGEWVGRRALRHTSRRPGRRRSRRTLTRWARQTWSDLPACSRQGCGSWRCSSCIEPRPGSWIRPRTAWDTETLRRAWPCLVLAVQSGSYRGWVGRSSLLASIWVLIYTCWDFRVMAGAMDGGRWMAGGERCGLAGECGADDERGQGPLVEVVRNQRCVGTEQQHCPRAVGTCLWRVAGRRKDGRGE